MIGAIRHIFFYPAVFCFILATAFHILLVSNSGNKLTELEFVSMYIGVLVIGAPALWILKQRPRTNERFYYWKPSGVRYFSAAAPVLLQYLVYIVILYAMAYIFLVGLLERGEDQVSFGGGIIPASWMIFYSLIFLTLYPFKKVDP